MSSADEQLHAASWPTFVDPAPHMPVYSTGYEVNYSASRIYAVEVGCYVFKASSPLTAHCADVLCGEDKAKRAAFKLGGGCSMVFDPEGREVGSKIDQREEGLIYVDVDLDKCHKAKSCLDTVGHYSRPDVFRVLFDPRPRQVTDFGPHQVPQQSSSVRRLRSEMWAAQSSSPRDTVSGGGLGNNEVVSI
jgi:nitrilase